MDLDDGKCIDSKLTTKIIDDKIRGVYFKYCFKQIHNIHIKVLVHCNFILQNNLCFEIQLYF